MMIRRRSGVPNAQSLQEFADALQQWGYVKRKIGESDMIDYTLVKR
jgi:hypothetical protein